MFGPDTLALFIPIVALAIPIVAVLTAHQRKMAEIIYSRQSMAGPDVEALRQEVQQLRSLVNQQAITIDDMRNRMAQLPPQAPLQERLGAS